MDVLTMSFGEPWLVVLNLDTLAPSQVNRLIATRAVQKLVWTSEPDQTITGPVSRSWIFGKMIPVQSGL